MVCYSQDGAPRLLGEYGFGPVFQMIGAFLCSLPSCRGRRMWEVVRTSLWRCGLTTGFLDKVRRREYKCSGYRKLDRTSVCWSLCRDERSPRERSRYIVLTRSVLLKVCIGSISQNGKHTGGMAPLDATFCGGWQRVMTLTFALLLSAPVWSCP